jgi:hypothetical protein
MTAFLVVNADDLGASRGATLGIVKAHREGIVTSASLLVTSSSYGHALETCVRACPDLGVGLHFSLSAGKPVSARRRIPLLIDENGFFRWEFPSLLRAAALQRRVALLEQVEIELDAQLQRLMGDGVRPDHIDGERHVHLIPGIFERVVSVASRHGVRFVRLGRDIGPGFCSLRDLGGLLMSGGFFKLWLLSALSKRNRARLDGRTLSTEHLASYLYTGRLDLLLRRFLCRPPLAGVTEVMVHPGIPEESRGVELGNRELERYLASEDRRRELKACIEARGRTHGWTLTNFTRLAREMSLPC